MTTETQSPRAGAGKAGYLDAWQCDRCNGDGWHYVEREGVDPRDIVRTKEHCEECDGLGWRGPDAKIAAGVLPDSAAEVVFFDPASRVLPEKAGLIIDASLAFFDSAKIGDKLYSEAQMRAALNRHEAAAPAAAPAGWTSVEDRLPLQFEEVLVAFKGLSLASTGQYTGSAKDRDPAGWCYPAENNGTCDDGSDPVVTHWMPLPTPPGIPCAATAPGAPT